MVKRVNNLEELDVIRNPKELSRIINEGKPTNVLYDLGKGPDRTELMVTHFCKGGEFLQRIASSPLIKLCEMEGGLSMDITDSNPTDLYSYRNLTPHNAVYGKPEYPRDEVGDVRIDLGEGETLGITQIYRRE